MNIRTQRFMTITEAHPFHGMSDEGRANLDRGGNAEVWIEYDESCPLCRAEFEQAAATDRINRIIVDRRRKGIPYPTTWRELFEGIRVYGPAREFPIAPDASDDELAAAKAAIDQIERTFGDVRKSLPVVRPTIIFDRKDIN